MNHTLAGFKVVLATPYPKMQLSKKVPVTDEFRAEIDAWMLEFFGCDYLIGKGETIVMEQQRIIMIRPDDYAKIRGQP